MTDDEKMDKVVEYLTEGHIPNDGGYAHDHTRQFPGFVVVAEVDHNGASRLAIHTVEDLLAQYDRAVAIMEEMKDEEGYDFNMAMLDATAE